MFWYDVCDFNQTEKMGFDRNSLLQHAWAIYNSYLSPTARFNIGLPLELSEEAIRSLQLQTRKLNNTTETIDSNIFQPVMEQIVPYLHSCWLEFVKSDVNKYTSARIAPILNSKLLAGDSGDENPIIASSVRAFEKNNHKLPDPEIVIDNNTVYVKRPWVQNFLTLRSKHHLDNLKKKRELTDEEKAERARRIKQMEIERRKALRAAAKRAKLKTLSKINEESTQVSLRFSSLFYSGFCFKHGQRTTIFTSLESSFDF